MAAHADAEPESFSDRGHPLASGLTRINASVAPFSENLH
jgi:hypothetical protein